LATAAVFLRLCAYICSSLFFFNDTATTEIYTLSLHDALPILAARARPGADRGEHVGQYGRGRCHPAGPVDRGRCGRPRRAHRARSEEHTSELSHRTISYAVFCLKKKKKKQTQNYYTTKKQTQK